MATSADKEAPEIDPLGDLEDMVTSHEGQQTLHNAE